VSRYIEEHRGRFGVEPICRILGVSASAYYQRATGERCERAVEDERLLELIKTTHERNYFAYGYRRMWKALLRAGEQVSRCRVQRLMRTHRIVGAKRRGKPWRTTRPDAQAHRRPDLVRRDFTASGPNQLWVADLSYLRCWQGVVFFAFVIDAFSRRVVGWQLASHMRTTLVLDALRMALARRDAGADVELVHHSDRGSQGGFNWSSQHLDRGGCDGQASGMDEGVDGPFADEVAWGAVASARHGARVLAADHRRLEHRGRCPGDRGFDGGWRPMVSRAWRDGDVHARRGLMSVLVL
jgi:hypothetical protein